MSRGRVLVVEDKESMRRLVREVLAEAHEVAEAEDARRALALMAADPFDVVVSDIRMPGMDGYELLAEIKRVAPETAVVLITAFASVERAVQAMKEGAYHYLTKPFEPDELALVVGRAVEQKKLAERARRLEEELHTVERLGRLVGNSPPMQRLFDLIQRAARADVTVLVTGESGTGKELVARAIHDCSRRRDGPFVAVNCGALPENLVESELFGHARGAFTGASGEKRGLFEEAAGGTLFLDEVGDLPLPMQVKLTRVLQEGTLRRVGETRERRVDARVVAATNVDLRQAMEEGRFRQDLFYRLNIFAIRVPPLRERREDIPALSAHFLQRHRGRAPAEVEGLAPDALAALMAHDWPGNVRELENALERALAVCAGPRVQREDLPEEIAGPAGEAAGPVAGSPLDLTHKEYVEAWRQRASREYLVALMREFGGNVTRAARRAGTERESLHRLLRRHGIRPADFKR